MGKKKGWSFNFKWTLVLMILVIFQASTKELSWPESFLGDDKAESEDDNFTAEDSHHQEESARFSLTQFKKDFKNRLHLNLKNWFIKEKTPQAIKTPPKLDLGWDYEVDLTLNPDLSHFIADLLQRFRSDYTSIAVIDNDTGNVLSLVEHGRDEGFLGMDLTMAGQHPSASLFKIITSADLLKNSLINKESLFNYQGRSTTLFKYQLASKTNSLQNESHRSRRSRRKSWGREETFQEAFAKSNNVIFGKAIIDNDNKQTLLGTAKDLGFEQGLMDEISLPLSKVMKPSDQYSLAELASGFNTDTTMTSLHGALLSSVVANNGVMKFPKMVYEVRKKNSDEVLWQPQRQHKTVLPTHVALELQSMMETAVRNGTARKVYREMDKKLRDELYVGGKTGSITGGVPFGKRDWFTAYAMPANPRFMNGPKKGISVCVMIINQKKWYVKSTFLAKKIIEYYYNVILSQQEKKEIVNVVHDL